METLVGVGVFAVAVVVGFMAMALVDVLEVVVTATLKAMGL